MRIRKNNNLEKRKKKCRNVTAEVQVKHYSRCQLGREVLFEELGLQKLLEGYAGRGVCWFGALLKLKYGSWRFSETARVGVLKFIHNSMVDRSLCTRIH